MKYSRYNYSFSKDDAYYIFNFRTGSLVAFENYSKIASLKSNDFIALTDDELESLTKVGVLVNENDEFLSVVYENNNYIDSQSNLDLTIFTTTGCNAKCDYCFEKGIKKENMSNDVADSIVSFIANNSIKKVSLNWFGGEPLVNASIIEYIAKKLNDGGIEFTSNITTNGFLVDKHLQVLKEANTKRAQITLDGIFLKYDKIKKFPFPNAFKRVINNIHLLLNEGIRVSIRLNFDKNNIRDILETIDYIDGEFTSKEKEFLIVYGHHIFENCDENELCDLYAIVTDELYEKGFIRSMKELGVQRKHSFCGINKKGFLSIMPDGSVFKCEHYASAHIKSVGIISQLSKVDANFIKTAIPNKCKDCIIFPACGGGCDYYNSDDESLDGCSPIKYCYENLLKKMIIINRRTKQ